MNPKEIEGLLQYIGERVSEPVRLMLIGGGALAMLGSSRPTIDLDFIGDDLAPTELHLEIIRAAKEKGVYAEPVPLERFIPLPKGSNNRNIPVGRFGNLEVFVVDPYSIALSKLDRGFDTDLDDIVFLLRRGFIGLPELERVAQASLVHASEFELNSAQMMDHLKIVRRRI